MDYGQFCPVAKATELLGERWTFLIVRELLMGGRRFSELQRGLGAISPALLTQRLKAFEAAGLVVRRRLTGQRGYEYLPTRACEELTPVLAALGEWGVCWARRTLGTEVVDVEFLMLYLERSVDPAELPGEETVIQFKFRDLAEQQDWWLLVRNGKVEICITPPGRDVDVFFITTTHTMRQVWMGERSYRDAVLKGELTLEGAPALTRRVSAWLRPSVFARVPPADAAPEPALA
ncbi:MAG: transcriptional regulator [Caulobacterales bacterium]|nr:transcriptional regulator [Caulobacterales bacterium]